MSDAQMGIAPADAVARRPWPVWRKILAYLLLVILASVSIWFIDHEAMRATYFWDQSNSAAK